VAAVYDLRIIDPKELGEARRRNLAQQGLAEALQTSDVFFSLSSSSSPDWSKEQDRTAIRPGEFACQHREFVWSGRHDRRVSAQHCIGLRPREHDEPRQDFGHRVEANAHRGNDTKIAASSSKCPE